MISSLTPEQEEQLALYREKWIKIGLSTEPLDLEKTLAAARNAYTAANVEFPDTHYVARSPKEAAELASGLSSRSLSDCVSDQIYGCHDAGWLSFYDYVSEVLKLDCVKPLEGLIELAKHCGWWAPYDTCVIFQDRPSEIHRDTQNRTHNETGPAILYRDGTQVFIWHGVRVPELVVMNPEQITAEMIRSEANAEVRRIMLERYGFKRYLDGADDIDFVHRDGYGTLYKHTLNDVVMYFVKVTNGTPELDGTYKDYILTVSGEPKTALEAVASTYKMGVEDYLKMDVRT